MCMLYYFAFLGNEIMTYKHQQRSGSGGKTKERPTAYYYTEEDLVTNANKFNNKTHTKLMNTHMTFK